MAASATRAGRQEANLSDNHHNDNDQDAIDAFLREEGVPGDSQVTRDDVALAVATLGYTVAAAAVKFVVKMSLRRLDTLSCVEGELRRDQKEKETQERGGSATASRPSTSALGWCHHLYCEDKSALTFLRGGWAELGFVLATTAEESVMMLALRSAFQRLYAAPSAAPRSGWRWAGVNVVAPMLIAGLLSWPLRAIRTTVMVNYLADTAVPRSNTESAASAPAAAAAEPSAPQHRYRSAAEVCRRVQACMGVRRLLRNGLDVDVSGRVVSMALVWTVVQPVTRWFREVAVVRARAAAGAASAASPMPSSPSLLVRLGHYRYFNLAALVVVVGTVNTLQRPFVVLRHRMALLPSSSTEAGAAPHGRRYASGWDCACQVVRREGVVALFAGLPLCLLTSTVVPLVVTFAGFPTAPSFSGAAV